MAITTTTIGINTGNTGTWSSADVIPQFEQAFAWLGWHGDTKTGLCVGISTITGGGTLPSVSVAYEDVEPISTTGIGTGASFYVARTSGVIHEIFVNRPGYGYTGGEVVTLSAEDIGGSGNGATNMTVKVAVAGTIANTVGYAVTLTDLYVASGTDRNGVVSGQATTITIKEGDTLTFTNNQSSGSYGINIVWNATKTTNASDTNRVFNVSGQSNSNTLGGVTSWTPLPGQAGTYFVNNSFSGSFYGTVAPEIIVLPADPADITYTGFGSTATFYSKDIDNGNNDYGILRHTIQSNKKYGDTYRTILFQHNNASNIYFGAGSGYFPSFFSTDARYSGGHAFGRRFAGTRYLDLNLYDIRSGENDLLTSTNIRNYLPGGRSSYPITTGGNTQYQLDLNIFRSSLDPKFAVFSFKAPYKPSSHISGNTYGTFIFHNFTTDIWDLDDVFLGGLTQIFAEGDGSVTQPFISLRSQLTGLCADFSSSGRSSYSSKRIAEFGYAPQDTDDSDGFNVLSGTIAFADYSSITYPQTNLLNFNRIYYRNSNIPIRTKGGGNNSGNSDERNGNASISSNADFNAVIKGIPLNSTFVPSPYYIPDDFVLIDFDYGVPNANIQQGDTITISGSEVYTVITGSYNNTNSSRTRGILFCARTV